MPQRLLGVLQQLSGTSCWYCMASIQMLSRQSEELLLPQHWNWEGRTHMHNGEANFNKTDSVWIQYCAFAPPDGACPQPVWHFPLQLVGICAAWSSSSSASAPHPAMKHEQRVCTRAQSKIPLYPKANPIQNGQHSVRLHGVQDYFELI